MRSAAGLLLAALVLVPAQAGAGTARPPLGLTATPARVSIAGSGTATVRVTNPGRSAVVVDVARAGFSLDLRGRPKIVSRGDVRAATPWLAARPGRFVLPPGASRPLVVSSRLPDRVEPGDHDALVLLTTRPQRRAGVALQMRLGVVVVVRAPGKVVRALALGGLHVRRDHGARVLELAVANRGNVTETIDRGRARLTLRRGRAIVRLRPEPRDLRPRTSGLVQFRYRGRLAGRLSARVDVRSSDGAFLTRRTLRVTL